MLPVEDNNDRLQRSAVHTALVVCRYISKPTLLVQGADYIIITKTNCDGFHKIMFCLAVCLIFVCLCVLNTIRRLECSRSNGLYSQLE